MANTHMYTYIHDLSIWNVYDDEKFGSISLIILFVVAPAFGICLDALEYHAFWIGTAIEKAFHKITNNRPNVMLFNGYTKWILMK